MDFQIKDIGLKYDYTYYPSPKTIIKFGWQSYFHTFQPAKVIPQDTNNVLEPIIFPNVYAWENAVYAAIEQKIGSRFEFNLGLRYSFFSNIGAAQVYQFNENYDTIATLSYGKGNFYNTYHGPEPRLGMTYTLSDRDAVKGSYQRTRQYLHIASVAANTSPVDTWIPSTPNIRPQTADQVAVGYFRNFLNNVLETSIEGYYKWMHNSIDFKDHANAFLNPLLEGELRRGKTNAMGLEFLLRKQRGKFTGWISYTLSKATRQIYGINNGNPYPANYDRRHNLNVVANYEINKRWTVAGTFIYYTGAPLTAPTGRMEYGGLIVPIYSERNGARMPDYHRMDVSATLHSKQKPNRKWSSSWVFSIYNVYNRKNAFMINFRQTTSTGEDGKLTVKTEAIKTYYFILIPSVMYNFNF